jgi:hypothetical protein
LLLMLALSFGSAWAGNAGAPTLRVAPSLAEPLPFRHSDHRAITSRRGIECVSCHPVRDDASLPFDGTGAGSLCHGCHVEAPGAPSACGQCHPVRAELLPRDHAADWTDSHGAASRRADARCDDCHTADTCVDCHDVRGALARTPHPAGFGATHGIEARLDPQACGGCHDGTTCTSCHAEGRAPW